MASGGVGRCVKLFDVALRSQFAKPLEHKIDASRTALQKARENINGRA